MTVPYTFANRTDTIPLAELDANFAAADSVVWGTVTGTLSDQADLQAALNSKDAAGAAAAAQASSTPIAHATDTANPHAVTKTQVGLGNVDNTSDVNKPVSTAQQTALNLKANATDVSNVDNTSDATKNAATATLTNKTILAATNTVEATSAPNGSAFGFRNKIINGSCQVSQRGPVAAVLNTDTYGGVDRFFVAPYSFSTASGSVVRGGASGGGLSSSGWLAGLTGLTTTGSGTVRFGQKIEAENTANLNGKTITISLKAYQVAGASYNAQISVYKANAADNFSGQTLLGTGSSVSVPNSVLTPLSMTLTLGASDATNGLAVYITYAGVGAVTGAAFYIGDLQLEEGSIATPFEQRPYGLELSLCQRYYQTVEMRLSGYTSAGIAEQYQMALAVRMRVTPTTTTGVTTAVNVTGPALFLVDAGHTGFGALGIAAGGYIATAAGTLSAEL